MEHIIQQLALDLAKNIVEKAYQGETLDLDGLAAEILEDCKATARKSLEAIIAYWNQNLRQAKKQRKEQGLVLKEKSRPRRLLTKLGLISWERDYYFDQRKGCYSFPLDKLMEIRSRERIGDTVSAELLNRATEVSYAKSADIVTGGAVSRQTVRNHLLRVTIPEQKPNFEEKEVRELHIYADEDHVHMQKPGKEKGKKNQIVPLAVVTEGLAPVSKGRNKTVEPMRFVDENFSGKEVWKSVEGYIAKAYDTEKIEKIYVHGDGGKWIQNGLESFAQTEHVIDGYHFQKELKRVARRHGKRNVRQVILRAVENNDRIKAEHFVQELCEEKEETKEFQTYLFGNWEKIRRRIAEDLPGSCTEGEISHVLSERFSRNPMGWSKEGLGKLSKLRVYRINGGILIAKDLKSTEEKETYAQYADRSIRETVSGAFDWSIFEGEPTVVNGNSGTQVLLSKLGADYGILHGNILS